MNEQPLDQNTIIPPTPETTKTSLDKIVGQVKEKAVPTIKSLLPKLKESKLYKNKLVFWTMTSLFGVLLLVIILGLLFGNRNRNIVSTSTSTPSAQNIVPTITQEDGPLFQINRRLIDLKTQIMTFDVKQSRLKAPAINFDVKF